MSDPRQAGDAFALEIAKNQLTALADEMALTIMRTARSQIVQEGMDFSTAIFDRHGNLIAQGLTIALHLGSLPYTLRCVLAERRDALREGDVVVVNDPKMGGTHLQDITALKPVFVAGELFAYVGCVAHHQDVGGRVPGSNAADSVEIYQEGIQIPPVRLVAAGELQRDVMSLLCTNVRTPELLEADLLAQLNALHVGEEGVVRLAGEYGPARLSDLSRELLDYSETLMRSALADVPDGVYEFVDHVDDDGFGSGPIAIKVTVTVADDLIEADFAGSSPQVRSALNATQNFVEACVYAAVLATVPDEDIPFNAGLIRPISVVVPAGSVLAANHPAARAARGLTGQRALEAVLGALQKALPTRVPAASDGGNSVVTIGGEDERGEAFVFVDLICGGWGGAPWGDGIDGISHLAANLANTPIELIESKHPVRIEAYGFLPDTGGAGTHRGCLSVVRDVRLLADRAVLQIRSDRRVHMPYGVDGGREGTPSWNILNPGSDERVLPATVTTEMRAGDVVRHVTAGGGGYGAPELRDTRLIERDVAEGKLSSEYVEREYGPR